MASSFGLRSNRMTLEKALTMIDVAKTRAQKITPAVTTAVCDVGANLVAVIDGKIIGDLGVSGGTWGDRVMAHVGLEAQGVDVSGVDLCLQDRGILPEKW